MAKTTAEEMLVKIVDKLDEMQKSLHNVDKDNAVIKAAVQEQSNDIKVLQEQQKQSNDIQRQNTKSLDEHMYRTDLLEKLHQDLDNRLTPIEIEKIEQTAIKAHTKELIIRWAKIVGALATVTGLIVAAKPFLLFLLTL